MRVSVVVLTYERPDALALVLRGLARQAAPPAEVVVSDDGSGPSTRAVVEAVAGAFPGKLAFVTEEHRGARMSYARNRGIAATTGDYVIFLDGDVIPGRHFVADHVELARPGCFVQGSRVLADERVTRELLATGRLDVRPWERGLERRRNALRVAPLRRLWARPNRSSRGAKSCNLAFWRSDLVAMNGFNEEMEGWGLEDDELVERALRLGLRRRSLRMGGVVVHLWHPQRAPDPGTPNRPIYERTLAGKEYRCARGLDGHLSAAASGGRAQPA
ncbi:MAG TPA: glycosyltransferase [Anaeromyxobacter sp.]|nr:glycosyltransferase [Anaeromyxobacter sp.]